ncbi:hypothetical protein SLEP1_g56933 [Rubroshorea leprosula]|uniref:Uncharacterized protein n=1 Tax=Rubroshorea leprosula TaxID=152421 RepID=A0AAV5MJX4_9ROSI|nr:hypothetical protein SLEP1_g56933 [Rubroshorea leprosula]
MSTGSLLNCSDNLKLVYKLWIFLKFLHGLVSNMVMFYCAH